MKTKDLERIKEYCKTILEHKYVCSDFQREFAHEFTTIAQNEIVKKNQKKGHRGFKAIADCLTIVQELKGIAMEERKEKNSNNHTEFTININKQKAIKSDYVLLVDTFQIWDIKEQTHVKLNPFTLINGLTTIKDSVDFEIGYVEYFVNKYPMAFKKVN